MHTARMRTANCTPYTSHIKDVALVYTHSVRGSNLAVLHAFFLSATAVAMPPTGLLKGVIAKKLQKSAIRLP